MQVCQACHRPLHSSLPRIHFKDKSSSGSGEPRPPAPWCLLWPSKNPPTNTTPSGHRCPSTSSRLSGQGVTLHPPPKTTRSHARISDHGRPHTSHSLRQAVPRLLRASADHTNEGGRAATSRDVPLDRSGLTSV
ncbi:uncharacterized protein LOC143032409 [Oratosquilla oratoria]|uniref:uncharacterized protein LOC143032409 n=1 Tax=Oratosquilla oratoria TaxID=337810 RepID=UPI003F7735CF